jgi:hypothetical protein
MTKEEIAAIQAVRLGRVMDNLVQVTLHDDCRQAGGDQEYPDGVMGKTVPEMHRSRPGQEGLAYVIFRKPFVVWNTEQERFVKKTDEYNGMFVPDWLLKPVQEPIVVRHAA